jgi:glycosyltransferase involved in cell wall biosynthesis
MEHVNLKMGKIHPGQGPTVSMTHPAVSVIIPTFNAAHLIGRCLDSFACQRWRNFEVLVVDGGSADGTAEVVEKYEAQLPVLRWVPGPDRGIYDAMNKGVAQSTGEWLYFIGADDQLHDDEVLADVSRHFSAEFDLVYGDIFRMSKQRWEGGAVTLDRLFNRGMAHQGMFYRRELLDRAGNYNLEYKVAADWDLNIRCFALGCRPFYIHRTVCKYDGGGFSANRNDEVFLARKHAEICRLFGATLWGPLFRANRYEFLTKAREARSRGDFPGAIKQASLFTFHAVAAKVENLAGGRTACAEGASNSL